MSTLPLIERAEEHAPRRAFAGGDDACSYRQLLAQSWVIASHLLDGKPDLSEARIAFLIPAGSAYAAVQWAIWQAGGVAVPLSMSATERELAYVLSDSQVSGLITTGEATGAFTELTAHHGIRLYSVDDLLQTGNGQRTNMPDASTSQLPDVEESRRAMILYTSGTTSQPKGVVTTHANTHAQIETLVEAWHWQPNDRTALFLPMHHVHGIINVMSCALWSGASIEAFSRFDPESILKRVADGAYSVFMAVPTIYVKIIRALEEMPAERSTAILQGFRTMRLMVSGSAALPASIHKQWSELTGQKLLERYGMTEIGMALSNPYDGERRPGAVGLPLPGVKIHLVDEQGQLIAVEGEPGEILVQGPAVFKEYWGKPEATADAFSEGWFRTGDMAIVEERYYRILGRQSVDIIKSGGYKLSALEIESVLSEHPSIKEVAVVGLPDELWGEAVSAAVVLHRGQELNRSLLLHWCRDRLSKYRIPKHVLVTDQLPRNAMGKITKPTVRELFERPSSSS